MKTTTDANTPSRYVVGVDLGTTNSAVAYVDTSEATWKIRTFGVPQLVAPGQVESRETLPSFHFEPAGGEFPPKSLRMAWERDEPSHVVGVFAREHGRLVPGRLIDSAKSWLCHAGVDRTAPLLPWHGAADATRLSPVEVSSRYLAHIRHAWDAAHRQHPLAEQDLVLTLPASFDEVARELTVEAAKQAGLRRVVLIEEPQAAFYAWIDAHRDDWESHVTPGQRILICDIGGGTSDFTLIRVRRQEDGRVQFHRVAVGQHLILGGDNFDLALAHHVEQRIAEGGKLEPRQWSILVRTCRHVKETLLSSGSHQTSGPTRSSDRNSGEFRYEDVPDAPEAVTLTLPGAGARLIGGGLETHITRDEVRRLIVDGFFPHVDVTAQPTKRQSGFQEFGLPYAADAAITKHLAAFLMAHRNVGGDGEDEKNSLAAARPDMVLFNGGIFASPVLRERLLDVIGSWFRDVDPDWHPLVLQNDRLDLAVAQGAAYYGMVCRGEGVRIAAGLARTYYVEVEAEPPSALCLVPAGIEPGHDVDLNTRDFELSLHEPVEFPLYFSSTRLVDKPGELVAIDREQMTPLPPIRTVLRAKKRKDVATVKVSLHARLTEIGTLELWCSETAGTRGHPAAGSAGCRVADVPGAGSPRSWQLQFDVRAATQTDVEAHTGSAERQGVLERSAVEACRPIVTSVFAKGGDEKPGGLPQRIAQAIEIGRDDWPMTFLRQIWEVLMEVEPGRRKSSDHEARWLNLLGFALRPGYGLALDDWRVAETWRALYGKLAHAKPMCRTEWWILWRRIAGGLAAGQQEALAAPLVALIKKKHQQMTTGRGQGADFASSSHEEAEVWRLLGGLERLDLRAKIDLGGMLVDLMPKRRMEATRPAMAWALGRIAARVPVYGPLNGVVPPDRAAKWLTRFLDIDFAEPMGLLAVVQMARRTGDRYRDLPEDAQRLALEWLTYRNGPEHYVTLIAEGGQLQSEEQTLIVGETLPRGLRVL